VVVGVVGNNLIPLDMTTPLLLNDNRFPPPPVDDDGDDDDVCGGGDSGEDNEDVREDLELSDDLLDLFDFDFDLLDLLFDFDLFGAVGGSNPSSPASIKLGVSLWNRPCANILVVFLLFFWGMNWCDS